MHEEVHVAGYGIDDIDIAKHYGWKYDDSKNYDVTCHSPLASGIRSLRLPAIDS